ncbi:HAD family hydrolase [Lachnospiraceae bacterium]|nr:HAD family hydrolase [Lachnospiraceae bacterium]
MSIFEPGRFCESVYRIPFRRLREEGVKGLIFDIDNTLVPPDQEADERSMALFRELREMGFRLCLLSNNSEKRVEPFARALRVDYVCKALKPRKYGYLKALERMGTSPGETISIGDQLFTDIWGANRVGMDTILVAPMKDREDLQIFLKRLLERPILWHYFRRKRRDWNG